MKPAVSLPFGISQFTTWPLSFEEDIRLYREAGVEFIEICEGKLDPKDPHRQLALLQESGLKVGSIQPRLHSLFPDAPRPEPLDPKERMACLRGSLELFAKYFPGAVLVSISGAAPGGDYQTAYETAVREYRAVSQIAGDLGMRLALEPLHPILMNVDTFLCSLAHACRVIGEVDEKALGILVDVWHIWEDASAEEWIRRCGPKIFGVHVNDWHTPRAFGDRILPGQGTIPLLPLLRALRQTGYAGPYTLEIFSETRLEHSLWNNPPRTVAEGKAAFAKLWSEVCA